MHRNLSFFDQVYEIVKCIPIGRVTSYGAIAKCLGSGKSSRMVGWAMNYSHQQAIDIPAHRVVNRVGVLTGKFHFGTENEMQSLLEKEGIIIENDKVRDFPSIFWDPNTELGL